MPQASEHRAPRGSVTSLFDRFSTILDPKGPEKQNCSHFSISENIVHTFRFSENGFRPHRLAGQSWRPLNKASWSRFAASSRWDRSRTPKPRKSDFFHRIFGFFRFPQLRNASETFGSAPETSGNIPNRPGLSGNLQK